MENLKTIEDYNSKMLELAKYATPGNYNEEKANQFYEVQKGYWKLKNKKNRSEKIQSETKKTFVNSFGEATKRNITSTTYDNNQKRLSKEVMIRIK